MMRCYLAHPVTDYGGTDRQRSAIKAIEARRFVVENPDQPIHQTGYREHGMAHFIETVEGCDALAFLRFPTGEIGAGVAKEIEAALTRRLEVFEIKGGRLEPIGAMMPQGVLSVDETRARIAAIRAGDVITQPLPQKD